jgi:trimeric autotransporter adhesin
VAVDAQGDLFIADTDNNAIREVTPGGVITTVAGTGPAGYTGDGGLATAATLVNPAGVAVGIAGELFIADTDNDVVRAVTGATLDVNANFTIPDVQVQGAGVLELDNGATLTANVVNSGTLRLGGSQVADGTIAGNYTQTGTGTLDIKLGGAGAGQSDQLQVTGNASLAGTLNVVLVDNFVPAQGDSFPILTFMGTLAGDFDTKKFPTLGNGNVFQTSSGSGSYTLLVTASVQS